MGFPIVLLSDAIRADHAADGVNDAALIRFEPYGEADDHVRRGRRVGPDGRHYSDSDLAFNAKGKTWQSMIVPPRKPSP